MAVAKRKLWKESSVNKIRDFVYELYKGESKNVCPVDKMRAFTDTTRRTSCGECVICREGILQLNVVAQGITEGLGRDVDIKILKEVSEDLIIGSYCDYGKEVGKITKKIIKDEQEEFEKHIKRKRCDSLVCKKFFSYCIAPEKCNGCNLCVKQCHKGAIRGDHNLIHIIDPSLCDRCGECLTVCEAEAIQKAGNIVPKVPSQPVLVGSFQSEPQGGGGLMSHKRRRRSE